MPRWRADLIGNGKFAECNGHYSATAQSGIVGRFCEPRKHSGLTQTPYSATRVKISSVCATFLEISNCDARLMLAERAASRRD